MCLKSKLDNKMTSESNKQKLFVISNRLPVESSCFTSGSDQKIVWRESPGGLVTALNSLKDQYERNWTGWPGNIDLETFDSQEIKKELKENFGANPVFLSKSQLNKYYFGFSNKVLWPIMHYLPNYCDFEEKDWKAYQEVNKLFARVFLKESDFNEQRDLIWIHDYHLMLLPSLIREKVPQARIGFFLHIPFPSSELFRGVPHRNDLLKGLLGANLIGFHTYDHLRHFRSSLLHLLGISSEIKLVQTKSHSCHLGVYPISIDTKKVNQLANSAKIKSSLKTVEQIAKERKIILSVDRLDYSKGIVRRLKGFKKFLEKNPKAAQKYCLIQVAVPSRTKIQSYKDLKEQVENLIETINEKFNYLDNFPITYLYKSLKFEKLCAFYKKAEIALVTSLRDGMNLVAKEFVAAKKDSGVLILSETAGAAGELGEAILVNPWNPDEIAEAINRATKTSLKEKKLNMQAMYKKIEKNDVYYWTNSFLSDLSTITKQRKKERLQTLNLDQTSKEKILADFKQAKRKLFLLDYDGTLQELRDLPEKAKPDKEITKILLDLSEKEELELAIVTGRPRKIIQKWLKKIKKLSFSTEHGLWSKVRNQKKWINSLEIYGDNLSWYQTVKEILEKFCLGTPGSFIEEKEASIAWHYRLSNIEFGAWQARELINNLSSFLANHNAEIINGNKVVEIKSSYINKGNAFRFIEDRLNHRQNFGSFDFVLAIGDDQTDEDMFASLPEFAYSIKVGQANSRASYRLNNVGQVRELLKSF